MAQSSDDETLNSEAERERNKRRQNQGDGGESGKKGGQQGNETIGFWHKELNATRKNVFKNWIITSTSF